VSDQSVPGLRRRGALDKLVTEIVAKAEGVFLWVKLVVGELVTRLEGGSNFETLKKRLDDLPTELDEYYDEMIQRIPKAYRWRTYMTLEIVARSVTASEPGELLDMVDLLLSRLQTDGVSTQGTNATNYIHTLQAQLTQNGGGLIEIVRDEGDQRVQFIHQTVRDFVADPYFKQRVLQTRAILTTSNGHTFLAQAGLIRNWYGMPGDTVAFHARQAEETTG
jgi:hypothetical protein